CILAGNNVIICKHSSQFITEFFVSITEFCFLIDGLSHKMLMTHFLDEDFHPEYLEWVAAIRNDEYYVKMMVAWYFATALAKQYESTLPIIEQKRLATWTHNKTIQKAIESYRITDEQKKYLKGLRRKE
ncbi:MAG: hypothetical protein II471_09050, partial [Bacteroidales bacterium]|nr:hypothetical protein [Bacteroidales bacterium]